MIDKLKCLKDNDILIICGSIPKSFSEDTYSNIIENLKNKNINYIIDANKELLKNTLKYEPLLIKPNLQELEEIFNVKINNIDEVLYYARQLHVYGAKNVIVSLGGKGACFISEDKKYMISAPKGNVIGTTGAGDSMIAGFVYGIINNMNLENCFKFSVASGSATAFSDGLLKSLEDVNNLYTCLDLRQI